MQEFAFELALCARLERERPDRLYARQLGGAVASSRVVDVVAVEPGPAFDRRTAITAETIPPLAVESDVGPGRARRPGKALDCHPERARAVADRAVEVGFFERERRDGHAAVRQTARYPDWFDGLVAIENKPDLARPGALRDQLRTDVSLALFDEVVLCTESYVTAAHRNRLPEEVGIWRFDPEAGERTVVREPRRLATDETGIELVERRAASAEIQPVSAGEKSQSRRRIAERAYGKGWRSYDLPGCARCDPAAACDGDAGLPWCDWKGRPVRAVTECGADCGGHQAGEPPAVAVDTVRARRTPWESDPDGVTRRQTGLDRFAE